MVRRKPLVATWIQFPWGLTLDACDETSSHFGSRRALTPLARAYSPARAHSNDFGAAVRRRAASTTEQGEFSAWMCDSLEDEEASALNGAT